MEIEKIHLKKLGLIILSFYLMIEGVFAAGIFDLLGDFGNNLAGIFLYKASVIYSIIIISLFMIVYSIFNLLFQKVSHLKGKPGTIMSVMFTVISLSMFFYNRRMSETINLFRGFTGLFFSILAVIAVFFLFHSFIKSKKTSTKVFFYSLLTYISTTLLNNSLMLFNSYASSNSSGFMNQLRTLFEIIIPISSVVAMISFLIFISSLFGKGNSHGLKNVRNEDFEKTKGVKEAKEYLELADRELNNINKYFNQIKNFLGGIK